MSLFKKTLVTLTMVGALLAGNAFAASGFTYGDAKVTAAAVNSANYATVKLRNFTWDTYRAYITFRPSGKNFIVDIGRRYSGYDVVSMNIDFPDTDVCYSIYRNFDGALVADSCQNGGEIWIGNPNLANVKTVTTH